MRKKNGANFVSLEGTLVYNPVRELNGISFWVHIDDGNFDQEINAGGRLADAVEGHIFVGDRVRLFGKLTAGGVVYVEGGEFLCKGNLNKAIGV